MEKQITQIVKTCIDKNFSFTSEQTHKTNKGMGYATYLLMSALKEQLPIFKMGAMMGNQSLKDKVKRVETMVNEFDKSDISNKEYHQYYIDTYKINENDIKKIALDLYQEI